MIGDISGGGGWHSSQKRVSERLRQLLHANGAIPWNELGCALVKSGDSARAGLSVCEFSWMEAWREISARGMSFSGSESDIFIKLVYLQTDWQNDVKMHNHKNDNVQTLKRERPGSEQVNTRRP
jgi:hypothetical protein